MFSKLSCIMFSLIIETCKRLQRAYLKRGPPSNVNEENLMEPQNVLEGPRAGQGSYKGTGLSRNRDVGRAHKKTPDFNLRGMIPELKGSLSLKLCFSFVQRLHHDTPYGRISILHVTPFEGNNQ